MPDPSSPTAETPSLAAFGNRLRLLRLHACLDQGELAAKVGVVRSSIANMEAGRQSPPLARVFDLAAVLDCTVGVLVGEAPDERLAVVEEAEAELSRIEAEMVRLQTEQANLRRKVSAATRRRPREVAGTPVPPE